MYFRFRTILTAAHCVCSHVNDLPEPNDPGYLCIPKGKNESPENQINPERKIYFIVGQKVIDPRLLEESSYEEALRNLNAAQRAYILETGKNRKGEVMINPSKDIGLIIVARETPLEITPTINVIKLPTFPRG